MIQIRNLYFQYSKGYAVFHGLDLTLLPGHVYGLLGKKGAGKTTLLKLMAGTLFPQAGEVTLWEQNATLRKPEILEELFFLPEEILLPHLSMQDFEKAYAPFYPRFSHEQFASHLAEFEIVPYENDYIDRVSHGQKKKIMLAFALAANTSLLLMDEPTNGLDIPSKNSFRKLLAEHADAKRLIVISTHQVRDLHSLIDAVTIVHNGQLILNANNDTITDKLLFDVDDSQSTDDEILYVEENLRGHYQVKNNSHRLSSMLDLELLFNAAISQPEKIKSIFK